MVRKLTNDNFFLYLPNRGKKNRGILMERKIYLLLNSPSTARVPVNLISFHSPSI